MTADPRPDVDAVLRWLVDEPHAGDDGAAYDLRAEGATDDCVQALPFITGAVSRASFTTDVPAGFSADCVAVPPPRRLRDHEPREIGLALHRGVVMYGNIGARDRLDYTVISAAVNEASRLESLCKALGTPPSPRPPALPVLPCMPTSSISASTRCAA